VLLSSNLEQALYSNECKGQCFSCKVIQIFLTVLFLTFSVIYLPFAFYDDLALEPAVNIVFF